MEKEKIFYVEVVCHYLDRAHYLASKVLQSGCRNVKVSREEVALKNGFLFGGRTFEEGEFVCGLTFQGDLASVRKALKYASSTESWFILGEDWDTAL